MTTKRLSPHGNPLQGCRHAANQQKKNVNFFIDFFFVFSSCAAPLETNLHTLKLHAFIAPQAYSISTTQGLSQYYTSKFEKFKYFYYSVLPKLKKVGKHSSSRTKFILHNSQPFSCENERIARPILPKHPNQTYGSNSSRYVQHLI